jgi:hypothetical protein
MDNQGATEATEAVEAPEAVNTVKWSMAELKMPTLGQLLDASFKDRQHLLYPWLREQESCMVYAATGVGKSLFALSVAIAVAGGGEFLGWNVERRKSGEGWKVLYLDGEMHIGDIQDRAKALIQAIPGIDKSKAAANLSFLPRQYQNPETNFPLITDTAGMGFIKKQVRERKIDLVILDNFSTLGEVADENQASSFNGIQQFLLSLKMSRVATMLVHHAGKSGDFRGSSKLAATFETIIELEKMEDKEGEQGEASFRVRWNKVRAGGSKKKVRDVAARLVTKDGDYEANIQEWLYKAGDLAKLDDIRDKLENGDFKTQVEIKNYYGVGSKSTIKNWLDDGIKLGIWTQWHLDHWFAKGNLLRNLGKRSAPVAITQSWQSAEGADSEPEVTPEF